MKTIRPLAVILTLFVSTAHAAIEEAEQSLQAGQFEAAIAQLDNAKPGDYPSYLKAVALYQSGDHAASVATAETMVLKYPEQLQIVEEVMP